MIYVFMRKQWGTNNIGTCYYNKNVQYCQLYPLKSKTLYRVSILFRSVNVSVLDYIKFTISVTLFQQITGISRSRMYMGCQMVWRKKMLNLTLEVKLQRGVDLFQFASKWTCVSVWQQMITCGSIRASESTAGSIEDRQLFSCHNNISHPTFSLPNPSLPRFTPVFSPPSTSRAELPETCRSLPEDAIWRMAPCLFDPRCTVKLPLWSTTLRLM